MKKIVEIYRLDCDDKVVVLGPHEETRTLCGPHIFIKLRTPFPESCEHSYYMDLDTWDVCDLIDFEDEMILIKGENI